MKRSTAWWTGGCSVVFALWAPHAAAQGAKPLDVEKARVVEHWTSARRANALPRDLVIDPRGLGYLRRPGGALEPYGHRIAAQAAATEPTPSPFAKAPGGGSTDKTPPSISGMNPSGGTIGASYTFSATVTDASGVRSVTFSVRNSSGVAQSFAATRGADGVTWSVGLQGFTDGQWSWQVVARDAARSGNTATSASLPFTVATASGGGSGTVTNSAWTGGGGVQTAAGRIYFEMPTNTTHTSWAGYVCSGTVATDGTSGRSIILTAAHCVYDDANKAFARNVMFIPDQAHTSGTRTDRDCGNDPMGCWIPSFGVVDRNWTLRTFPDNIAWDYAYYVVPDSGAHQGGAAYASALDVAAGSLAVSFAAPNVNDGVAGPGSPDFTAGLGYSYSEDPKFMYCAQDMTTQGAVNWWLASCGLSGGSSGGPWLQPVSGGNGPIVSVNSWGYTNQPGMAGPKLSGTSAACMFGLAKSTAFGSTGVIADCP